MHLLVRVAVPLILTQIHVLADDLCQKIHRTIFQQHDNLHFLVVAFAVRFWCIECVNVSSLTVFLAALSLQ